MRRVLWSDHCDARTTQALLSRTRRTRKQLPFSDVLPGSGIGHFEDELRCVEEDLKVDLLPEVVRVNGGLDARVVRGEVLECGP